MAEGLKVRAEGIVAYLQSQGLGGCIACSGEDNDQNCFDPKARDDNRCNGCVFAAAVITFAGKKRFDIGQNGPVFTRNSLLLRF